MSKLVVFLTVYAAAVASFLLYDHLEQRKQATTSASEPAFLDPGQSSDAQVRKVMAEARALLRSEIEATLKNVDWRLARIEALRASMEEGVEAAERTATEAGQANYGKLEAMQEEVDGFAKAVESLAALRKTLAGLETRLKEVEERPPQVIREVAAAAAQPGKKAADAPKAFEPKIPALPGPARKSPEVVAAEIAKAREDILSKDLAVLWGAIEKVRQHKVMDAVPRLIEIMSSFPEELGRSNAAAALGHMQVADAVPALTEALVDKSGLVAQQANKSIRQITGFDTQMSPSARVRERRTIRSRVKEWWRAHEEEVRKRLGQPAGGP